MVRLLIILVLIIAGYIGIQGCKGETNSTKKVQKSYEPKTTVDESLPQKKIQIPAKEAKPVENPTFRKVKWGMSKEEVKIRESGTLFSESDTVLAYNGITVGGLDAQVGYVFVDNKLYRGVYVFVGKHSNENTYISDYENLKDILTAKYGTPFEDKKQWGADSDYYKDRPGQAISMGKLIYYAKWTTTNTQIILSLYGENFNTKLSIEYETLDPELLKLKEDTKRKQNETDF